MQKQQIIIDAAEVRTSFADLIQQMVGILEYSEQQEKQAFGESVLKPSTDKLNFEIKKLRDAKFRFLVIGDFNRGKSSILNVLLEQEDLLPVGATATTAIPTFIKYGEQKKVSVHLKDGSMEELSIEGYKNKYTLNSKEVRNKLKHVFKSVGEWLNPLDYAVFYSPVELLSRNVEFIDTAGLNHTLEEDKKTFEYIKDSHAVIFVLSAEQQLTDTERTYLREVIKDKVSVMFFIINKWETIEQKDKEEIHEEFVDGFSTSLDIPEDEVRKMWGNRIFDVYAKNALAKLKNKDSLEETGFLEFTEQLNSFLINERLINELYSPVQTAKDVATSVTTNISDILLVLYDDLKTLEEKIKKVKPHINVMKRIVKSLDSEIKQSKNYSSSFVMESYKSYFLSRANSFEREFTMPQVPSLGEKEKRKYVSELSDLFTKYQQEKLEEWNKLAQSEVIQIQDELTKKLHEEILNYESERDEIREILNENSKLIQDQAQLQTSKGRVVEQTNLTEINANATRKVVAGLAGGTVATMAAGVGAATAANVYLGTHLIITTVLGLTPLGWGLLAASSIVGGALAIWGRSSEVDKFKNGMLSQLKEKLHEAATDTSQVSLIGTHIQSLFFGFEKINRQLLDDVESLEGSLNNLLESKRRDETDYEVEKKRLEAFSESISAQWEIVNAEYTKIATTSS